MKRVTVCLGVLFAVVTCSYAQDSSPDRLTQDHEATATQPKLNDEQSSEKETHLRFGGIAVSASYAHFWPGMYPYGFPYGPFYSPVSAALWWDPFWGFFPPVYAAAYFRAGDGKGEIKLNDAPKSASVYLNGGYAGTVEHLRNFWLDPGVYDLMLSAPDGREYQQRVYVLTGKTLKIGAKLAKPMTDGERM